MQGQAGRVPPPLPVYLSKYGGIEKRNNVLEAFKSAGIKMSPLLCNKVPDNLIHGLGSPNLLDHAQSSF